MGEAAARPPPKPPAARRRRGASLRLAPLAVAVLVAAVAATRAPTRARVAATLLHPATRPLVACVARVGPLAGPAASVLAVMADGGAAGSIAAAGGAHAATTALFVAPTPRGVGALLGALLCAPASPDAALQYAGLTALLAAGARGTPAAAAAAQPATARALACLPPSARASLPPAETAAGLVGGLMPALAIHDGGASAAAALAAWVVGSPNAAAAATAAFAPGFLTPLLPPNDVAGAPRPAAATAAATAVAALVGAHPGAARGFVAAGAPAGLVASLVVGRRRLRPHPAPGRSPRCCRGGRVTHRLGVPGVRVRGRPAAPRGWRVARVRRVRADAAAVVAPAFLASGLAGRRSHPRRPRCRCRVRADCAGER